MKKLLFLSALMMALPASASVVVNSPVVIRQGFVDAPLAVGGFASVKGDNRCCMIVRIVDVVYAGPDNPIWITTYYSDSSGNFPADNSYWQSARLRFNSSDLQGLTPA